MAPEGLRALRDWPYLVCRCNPHVMPSLHGGTAWVHSVVPLVANLCNIQPSVAMVLA